MIASELFAPGGVQRVGRDVIDALTSGAASDAVPLVVWSLRDAATPGGGREDYDVPAGAAVRFAAGSRVRLGSWAIARAVTRCDDTQVLLMHVHLAPIAAPMLLRGARVVVFLYGVEVWRPLTFVERFVLNRAARVIAISSYTAQRFRDVNRWFRGTIDVCPLGVAPESGAAGANLENPASAANLALIVSRICAEDRYKGHEPLIRAWAAVRTRVPDATLAIVGDGDDRPRLEALAAELALDGAVRFIGRVSDRELSSWYARCTLFVMPSPDEGFGLVFLEAMRAGKPCIGAAGAAAEVIVDGVTGTIVPSAEPPILADTIVDLFGDPVRLEQYGRNGRTRFLDRFTSAHFADRIRRLCVRVHSEGEAA